jgi:hypothetical protein
MLRRLVKGFALGGGDLVLVVSGSLVMADILEGVFDQAPAAPDPGEARYWCARIAFQPNGVLA